MNKLNSIHLEKISGGITAKDCFIAGLLEPYAFFGRWGSAIDRINSAYIRAVGDYCASQ